MSKKADLIILLQKDWVSVPELLNLMGWKSHTLRGALSMAAKKDGLKIERRRIDGVTSYRIEAAE